VDPVAFFAALFSAVSYACWNAAARARPDPGQGFAIVVIASGLLCVPLLAFAGLPDPAAWPWMAGSILSNLVAMRSLMATYRLTPFAVGFPIARGLTPPLVAGAALVGGEALALPAVFGIVAVSLALTTLGLSALRGDRADPRGLAMAVVSSIFSAGYIFMDAVGARASGSVLSYAALLGILNAMTMAGLAMAEGKAPWRLAATEWRFGLMAAVVSMASYLALLFAFTRGPIGPVSAIRETSVLFATALAALLLKERVGATEWIAVVVAVAGIMLIRLS